jgi:hypothetical protein
MTTENNDLVPLPRHQFDMVPPEIHKLFEDILKYRVDPSGTYYGVQVSDVLKQISTLDNNAVVAIDSDVNYSEKGHMYDPILQSFVQGAGGRISSWNKEDQNMTPVVLRGVTKRKQMNACREAGRDFYYIDTGYFGNGKKKTYHRITKNDVQNFGAIVERPMDRLAKCNINIKKMRRGTNILIAPPSQKLLNLYNINLEDWLTKVQTEIGAYTDRPIIVREKQSRSVRQSTDTMEAALDTQDIHCLVTFSSIAAGEALINGKPAITLGPNAAAPLCSQHLSAIENPHVPSMEEVHAWAAHLSYCQFTEAEMRDGTAWRILNGN